MITRQGRSAEHGLERLAEQRRAGAGAAAAASRSRAARISRASSTIRWPASPGRTFSQCPVTRRPPEHARRVDHRLRARLLLGQRRVDRRGRRHGDRHEHVDAAPPPRGQPHRGRHRVRRVVARPRTRPAPTRTRPRARPTGLGMHDLVRSRSATAPGGAGRARSVVIPSASQTAPAISVVEVEHRHDDPRRSPVPSPPKTANSGSVAAARRAALPGPRHGRSTSGLLDAAARSPPACAIVNDSIAPNA